MTIADPYRVLGIAPDADETAIRAAYRAGMKRFHPDQNRADDAADRSREVAAAYALLSDPARRARFDRERHFRENLLTSAPPPSRAAARARGRAGGLVLVLLSAGIVAFALNRTNTPSPTPTSAPPSRPAAAAPAPAPAVPPPAVAAVPVAPPTAPAPAPPPELADAAPLPLPPLPAAAPPMPLQKVAPVKAPAATLAPPRQGLAERPAPRAAPATPAPAPVATAAAPRATCDTAPTCAQIDLAALDRLQTQFYNQSYLAATAPKQALLLSSRSAFLARMARCASAACKRDTYLARNREIAAIMRG